ncbi:unnamed protein product [Ceutorhynchus assimilis]|uniref:26S proteasome non-ATPase regulatory subunit 6 n=1 Tax=Ceutorhynchus assimilis TaxID=467358 RepID=A0A9N9QJ88_9CUCU|nr:unnamed protein product [Ceutorhynchus assimilis]
MSNKMDASDKSICKADETEKNPNLEIAQLKFLLALPEFADDEAKSTRLLQFIQRDNMAPYYEIVCTDLKWEVDNSMLEVMKDDNMKILLEFDTEIDYACNNLGSIDIKEAYLNKAYYLSKIGDKEQTIQTLRQAYANTIALGYKLDNLFHCIRIGLFFNDLELIGRNLLKCDELIEEGADWHHRNCLKIYKGLYSLASRNFTLASEVLTNAIATFVCTELISFEVFIKYAILSALLHLSRKDLKKEIITNPDVLQALHENPSLKELVFSLYNCKYKDFFNRLAEVELEMQHDMLLQPHYKFYVREMKIKSYDQLLSTYISLNISYMAQQFGVTDEYIEKDVSEYIAARRLNYKIDKVSGKIHNISRERKAVMFEKIIRHGDLLLNRIQKFSKVINI